MDTAKKPDNDENEQEEPDADCKEEAGIDMSEDFESKLQDVNPNDSSEEEDDESEDPDKQMGETEEGADK